MDKVLWHGTTHIKCIHNNSFKWVSLFRPPGITGWCPNGTNLVWKTTAASSRDPNPFDWKKMEAWLHGPAGVFWHSLPLKNKTVCGICRVSWVFSVSFVQTQTLPLPCVSLAKSHPWSTLSHELIKNQPTALTGEACLIFHGWRQEGCPLNGYFFSSVLQRKWNKCCLIFLFCFVFFR